MSPVHNQARLTDWPEADSTKFEYDMSERLIFTIRSTRLSRDPAKELPKEVGQASNFIYNISNVYLSKQKKNTVNAKPMNVTTFLRLNPLVHRSRSMTKAPFSPNEVDKRQMSAKVYGIPVINNAPFESVVIIAAPAADSKPV